MFPSRTTPQVNCWLAWGLTQLFFLYTTTTAVATTAPPYLTPPLRQYRTIITQSPSKRTNTKEFCDTIATSITQYEKYLTGGPRSQYLWYGLVEQKSSLEERSPTQQFFRKKTQVCGGLGREYWGGRTVPTKRLFKENAPFQQTRVYPYPLGAGSARPNPKMGAPDQENPLFLGFSVLGGGLRPWSQTMVSEGARPWGRVDPETVTLSFLHFSGAVCSNTLFSNTSALSNSLLLSANSTRKGSRTPRLVERFWVPIWGAACSNKRFVCTLRPSQIPFESKLLLAVLLFSRIYFPKITVTVTVLKLGWISITVTVLASAVTPSLPLTPNYHLESRLN